LGIAQHFGSRFYGVDDFFGSGDYTPDLAYKLNDNNNYRNPKYEEQTKEAGQYNQQNLISSGHGT
jgi:hypothetical protein